MMRKNKIVQSGLVILVIAIWGGVFFQMNDMRKQDTYQSGLSDVIQTEKSGITALLYDTMKLNYKDPFLRQIKTERTVSIIRNEHDRMVGDINNQNSVRKSEELKKDQTESSYKKSDFRYLGCVEGEAKGQSLCFVKYKTDLHLFHRNDTVNTFKIKDFNNEALVLSRGNEEFEINIFIKDGVSDN